MKLILPRTIYTEYSTGGVLLLNDKFFSYTLEDRVRPLGEKVYGETAIPAGEYKLIVNWSERFGRMMPLLLDVPDFTGIRMHGGNRPKDTLGCILVAENRVNKWLVWKSKEKELTSILQKSKEEHTIEIIDTSGGKPFLQKEHH